MVMRRHFKFEIEGGNYRQAGSEKISLIKCTNFCDISTGQHTATDSYVPRGKISGSGCSPLAIGGKVDKQRIKCRKHDSKSDPHQQCDAKKQDVANGIIPLNQIYTG